MPAGNHDQHRGNSSRRDLLLPAALGAATALLHILTAHDSYGIFRDELYYVACSEHPAWGYVDHPPLVAWLTWVARTMFGDTLVALRLLPALAAGATVFLTSRLARELGGMRFAQALAGILVALAPIYVSLFGILSMNAFDVLIWTGATLILIRILRSGDLRGWLVFGLVAGIGLQNKLSIVFLGSGLVAGLLVTRSWRHFTSWCFWLGGAIALGLFLPNLVWQVVHDWPTLEFMDNATRFKNMPLSPLTFLSEQVPLMNPLALPAFVAGLVFYLAAPAGRPYRALGWTFIGVIALMITQRAKPYYLSPSYTMILAPGAVMLEHLTVPVRRVWLRPAYLGLVLGSGALLVPLAKPVLPVESFVAYARRLGQQPSTDERKEVGRLPQFFADRLGWPELAATVAEVHRSLPPADRERACILGQNYGQAGAIDFFGPELGLPPALSGHNSYYLWGPRDCTGEVVIVIGGDREDHLQAFEQVEQAALYTCRDCMPYENDKPIWICRDLRASIEEIWPRAKHYD